MIHAPPDQRAYAGQWNSYVVAGPTRDERRARLEECPEHLRQSVQSHVTTVFALRARAGRVPQGVQPDQD